MKLLYILLFFACSNKDHSKVLFTQLAQDSESYIVYNRPDFPDDYHQIEYIGNWKHMKNGGSYANTAKDTARFAFWGYGVQIRTELMDHHKAYKIFIDGNYIESINVQNTVNTTHNLTYSNMNLKTGNHVLELVPDGGYFVLNTLTIHYFVDPTPDDPCDSTAINWTDSIRWIEKDTTIIHHVYDTTDLPKLEFSITRSGRFQIYIGDSLLEGEHNEYEKAIEHALKVKSLNLTKNVTIKSPIRNIKLN